MTTIARTPPTQPRLTPSNGVPLGVGVAGNSSRTAGRSSGEIRLGFDRLALTRRAHHVMRRHLLRAALRISVLMAGDAGALLVLRFLIRGIRDLGWWGPTAAHAARGLVPPGALPTVQLLPAVLLGLIVLDTYGANDRRRDAGRLVAGASFGLALPFWGYLWTHFSYFALPGFVLLAGAVAVTLIAERQVIDDVVRTFWPIGPGAARALLIGLPEDTRRAMEHPALSDSREFAIEGVCDPNEVFVRGTRGQVAKLCQTIKRHRADTLVLCSPFDDEHFALVTDAARAAGCQLFALTRSFSVAGLEPFLVWRRGAPLVVLNRPSLRGRQLLIKRSLDLVCASIGLLLLAPLFGLIALAVRLSSRGPIFFRQTRVGLGGSTFRITKFRTMVQDAEERRQALAAESLYSDQRLFKLKNDPRVTRVGAFLRRTSLDELPQLWNVLKGEMSLVGPRPPLPSEVALYEEHHYNRFDVKPGITGPWQVGGRNTITDFEEVIRLETAYIREWTIWKDLGILLRTVPAVVYMRGAH
ncbi:MAG TPA: sugar transferase [Gemmatimonadales bacterium]|nr:sugar transferase [Gemmatimonadales bacterium]